MSENGTDKNSGETGQTNLIVNYLPQNLNDEEFLDLFASVGTVTTARVIRDKNTGYSYGYGFVDYEKAEDAAKAIQQLDKHKIQHKVLKVAYSKPSGTQTKNINLYVSGLSSDCTEATIRQVFGKFGDIVQCNVIKDKQTQLCSGISFVLFSNRDEAETAIRTMSGQKVEGLGDKPITIKYARNEQRAQGYSLLPNFPRSQQSLFNNGPHRSLITAGFNGASPPGTGGFNGASPIRNLRMEKQRYSPLVPGNHYPGGGYFTGGPPAFNNFVPNIASGDQSTQGKVVFVYGIGPFTNEDMLRELCSPAGRVLSVNVIYDTQRGIGKGYGFVTYQTEKEANEAVRCLDKCPYQGRLLQVSIKS